MAAISESFEFKKCYKKFSNTWYNLLSLFELLIYSDTFSVRLIKATSLLICSDSFFMTYTTRILMLCVNRAAPS